MPGTRAVYFVDSENATVFHYFRDCPALGQAVHRVVEELVDELAVVVATETYGDLPLCMRCKAHVERDENLTADAWKDRAAGHRADAPQDPPATLRDVRQGIENAISGVFMDPVQVSDEQVQGTAPLLVIRQDLGEFRIYGDRAEIDWLGTLYRGVPDVVVPYESVTDVHSTTWIPAVRAPAVILDCIFEDGEAGEVRFEFDIRESPEQVELFLRELVMEWGKLDAGATVTRTPDVSEAPVATPVAASTLEAEEAPGDPPALPALDPPPSYEDAEPPHDADLVPVAKGGGEVREAEVPAESEAVFAAAAGTHAVRAMALSVGARRHPVIFIPGTGGSFLKMPVGGNTHRQPGFLGDGTFEDRWDDATPWIDMKILDKQNEMRDWLAYLRRDEAGRDAQRLAIYPVGIFEYWPVMDFYSGLIKRLTGEGYAEGDGWLRKFSYDFRIDPTENATRLEQLVSHTLRRTGAQKVVLVSHSQGGLVARDYIVNGGAGKVRASITLGTPFLGVVWCMKALAPLGWDFGQAGKVDPQVIGILAQNWPAVYAMLPAEEWFYEHPAGFLDFSDEAQGWRTATAQQQVGFVLQNHNRQLYDRARAWRRRILDGNDHGVENIAVVGDRPNSTPAQYQLVRRRDGRYGERLMMTRGDGTVTLGSGLMQQHGSRIGPLKHYAVTQNDSAGTPPDHSSLANHKVVQDIVARELASIAQS